MHSIGFSVTTLLSSVEPPGSNGTPSILCLRLSFSSGPTAGSGVLTEIQPLVFGEAVSDPLGVIRGLPECSQYLIRSLPLVVEQCCQL